MDYKTKQNRAPSGLLRASELAERLGLKTSTVRSWARAGKIPCLRLGNRTLRFKLSDVLFALSNAPDTAIFTSSEQELPDCRQSDEHHRWEVSLHEAGHAVVAHALGLTAQSVRLLPDGGGSCETEPIAKNYFGALVAAAGPIAQKRFALEFARPVEGAPSEILDQQRDEICRIEEVMHGKTSLVIQSDESRLRHYAIAGGIRNPEFWASRLIEIDQEANEILDLHEDSVLNLARALYMRGELIGDDAENAMFWPGGVKPGINPDLANTTDPESKETTEEPPEPNEESPKRIDTSDVSRPTPNQLANGWELQTPSTQNLASASQWGGRNQ